MKASFELWEEGFLATGNRAKASYLGRFEGETFMDAYLCMVKSVYGDTPPDYVRLDIPQVWGCRIFDNEADARKSFG